ncbi:hypothetical protein N7462_003264 [Penicillium macrosclerotiorum]|uniref:uncharacterized protein n=1 Tax=Penicillium macrosclerotiorum TaxID=303699 RepID=UPI0025497FCC|nr:uncharacterized protein N7462_003264 [Penicillium macrosclerotiorum]KAJ5688872.1 hypothetical protein N7462_003264 [Penicillium macrosclerotiorum]
MAPATVGSLTEELITALVGVLPAQKKSPHFETLKSRVGELLRPGVHGRTDQFAVARQLDGLQEKFQVLDRDDLAVALRNRLAELETHDNSWHPEILSLLLQLSDRPAHLSKVERLETLVPIAPAEEATLSWADIDAHGTAFSDEDIWEEVDFAAGSSDDDFSSITSEVSIPPQTVTEAHITPEVEYVMPNEIFIPDRDEGLIESLGKSQFWNPKVHTSAIQKDGHASQVITELQLARETIFMLRGLPTSIFWRFDGEIEVDQRYTLDHSSSVALSFILQSFTQIGIKFDAVRRFTDTPQDLPYMQTFCRGIEDHLREFDGFLSQIERDYLSAGSTVSILQLLDSVRQRSNDLLLLSDLISKLGSNSTEPMRCLNLLYDLVCMMEALGNDSSCQIIATLFFSCFKTYTQSIQLWMETGQVDPSDTAFFVRKNQENGDLRTLWHDWFMLDEGLDKQKIPRFLEAGIRRVFNIGKSMVFLRHLNALPDLSESALKSDTMLDKMGSLTLSSSLSLPFSALVETAFNRLVDANHSISAGLLRTELDEQCGLWASLDALQHTYLAQDLGILSVIDAKIFELMDRGRSWDDKFLLTEVTRSAFGTKPCIDLSRLVVRSDRSSTHDSQDLTRTVRILETISIDYVLPWPVANLITRDAIRSYRQIATFLMQIRRSKYAVVKRRIRDARKALGDDRLDTLVYALHHHLLWFLDIIYAHLTHLVISTANQSLISALSSAPDVDAMIAAHRCYMSSLEDQCLLSDNLSPIREAIINLLDLCIHFADLQAVHAAENDLVKQGDVGELDVFRRRNNEDSDYDSDEEDDFEHEHTLTVSFRESSYEYQMRDLKRRFDHLITFVADGLKGVARADGLPSWNILAEKLDWRKGWQKI